MHHLKRKVNNMTGCYGNNPEDRARERELHAYLAVEEREVLRAEAIEASTDERLKEGQEYYPLNLCNFSEVLSEMKDMQVETIAKYVRLAKSTDFNDTMQNEMVARMLWVYAENYMRKYAVSKAEKEVE